MKEKPILFSTPMVQAIDQNRKTMTRRTAGLEKVNENPNDYYLQSLVLHATGEFTFAPVTPNEIPLRDRIITCKPRYQKGDHIWVKEEYYAYGYWIRTEEITKKSRKHKKMFIDCSQKIALNKPYLFENNKPEVFRSDNKISGIEYFKRNSLFMPKKASRIWLECNGVRCERLLDISKKDARDEGIEEKDSVIGTVYKIYAKKDSKAWDQSPVVSFMSLWDSINGEGSYLKNPWVFVYEFIKIEK